MSDTYNSPLSNTVVIQPNVNITDELPTLLDSCFFGSAVKRPIQVWKNKSQSLRKYS